MRPAIFREFPSLTTDCLRLRAPRLDDATLFSAPLSIAAVICFTNRRDAPRRIRVKLFRSLNVQIVRQR